MYIISRYKDVVINMDTTYWGRNFGLVIIKDTFRNEIKWHKFVKNDSVAVYIDRRYRMVARTGVQEYRM